MKVRVWMSRLDAAELRNTERSRFTLRPLLVLGNWSLCVARKREK